MTVGVCDHCGAPLKVGSRAWFLDLMQAYAGLRERIRSDVAKQGGGK